MALAVFQIHKLSHACILTNRQLKLLALEPSDKNTVIPEVNGSRSVTSDWVYGAKLHKPTDTKLDYPEPLHSRV